MRVIGKLTEVLRELLTLETDKVYQLDVKEVKNKRSLNANAYAWVLMDKIAKSIKTSKDKVYLIMLERYGVFTEATVRLDAVARLIESWRTYEELGRVTIDGEEWSQILLYHGSSSYNKEEMARFIDGIVSEAEEMGLETLTPREIARLKGAWE